ncbi:unnamed protein product [Ceutorhynchus assimilis]|uniref:Uncharacterized protein n=1 Tax=Ceutorhynchus assimilis TaxID=467358 RepID=A0A9N9MPV3_9CUCU|nr:unnamed protein product [Ceutorhynchus assimilis]
MAQFLCLAVILFISAILGAIQVDASSLEHDGSVVIKLQHALNGGPNPVYTERGTLTIHSLRLGQAIISQKPLSEADKKQIQGGGSIIFAKDSIECKTIDKYNCLNNEKHFELACAYVQGDPV